MRGIALFAVIPLRAEPNHRSEMVSQLLFGETYTVTERSKTWLQVQCDHDQYIGWIESSSHNEYSEPNLQDRAKYVTHRLFSPVNDPVSGEIIQIPAGSSVPGFQNNKATIGNHIYRFAYPPYEITHPGTPESVTKCALRFINTPYLWGGRNPMGIDCSGLVQVVYKMIGIELPRDASQQVSCGRIIDFVDEVKPGDLAFFDNKEGEIIHTGIILSGNHIIHCSGKVRVDLLDHFGIYNRENRTYTHSLRILKRL